MLTQHFDVIRTYVYCHFCGCWKPICSVGTPGDAQMFAQGSGPATLHEPDSHATTTKSSKYRSQVSAQMLAQGYTQVGATLCSHKIHPGGTL